MARAARRGDYGIDAPYVPALLAAGGLVMIAAGILAGSVALLGSGLFLLLSTASFLFTTRIGKLALWEELLTGLGLDGDEEVLDMGCGRGGVLIMAARQLPRGRATGIDLWSRTDQSGNRESTTLRNATLEGVADRVEVRTADMTDLPFPVDSFDVVVSSLALHNIKEPAGRGRAVAEAVRVLRPGGRVVFVDIKSTAEYAGRLRQLGMTEVASRGLGWRGWYGGPWMACSVVTARKPT